jgi:phospholipid N-methyltransferase
MEWISFIKQYVRMPRFGGAIVPSSKYLANKIIENIDFRHARLSWNMDRAQACLRTNCYLTGSRKR